MEPSVGSRKRQAPYIEQNAFCNLNHRSFATGLKLTSSRSPARVEGGVARGGVDDVLVFLSIFRGLAACAADPYAPKLGFWLKFGWREAGRGCAPLHPPIFRGAPPPGPPKRRSAPLAAAVGRFFANEPLVWGCCAARGGTCSLFFLKKPLVWGRTYSQKSVSF